MVTDLMVSEFAVTELLDRQIWQLTLVLIGVGLITWSGCRRRPHLAYALWLVVLVKALTPPLWVSNLSLFSAAGTTELGWSLISPAPQVPSETSNKTSNEGVPAEDTALAENAVRKNLLPTLKQQAPVPEKFDWISMALTIWLLGAIALASISVYIVGMRWRRMRKTEVTPEPELLATVTRLAEQLGLRRPVRVLVTTEGFGPALFGFWQPTIVLPQCVLIGKEPADCKPYLTHELIHLRRGDHLVSLLQSVVQIIWWFHPLVWWMNKQICQVRERCCDQESVCALAEPPARYAKCLVEVLDAKVQLRPVYGFPGVRPVQVTTQRLQEIMTMSANFQARTPAWCWAVAFVMAIVVLPGMPFAGERPALAEEATATTDKGATPVAPKKSAAKKQLLLKYGDNKPDGRKSIAGAGEMIRFDLTTTTDQVRAVRVHGSRYGYPQAPKEDFEVTILSADMKETLHTELVPYSLFKRAKKGRWTHVPFKEAVEVPQTFWVVLNFNAEATKGVYVSYDTSTKGKYSRVGTTDEDAKATEFKGDWMVQVLLAK